ncbi:MAG: hypothetical protein M3Q26_07200 [Acidobacteriota bacterium]|nr:hypothetical protein [Acidobacteriota bacterium]
MEKSTTPKISISRCRKIQTASHRTRPAAAAQFENSLGIPRSEMPQISRTDMDEFLQFAKDRGVSISLDTGMAVTMLPTQSEYNSKQAAQLPDEALKKPVTVSNEFRILDGHNIFARLRETHGVVIILGLPRWSVVK